MLDCGIFYFKCLKKQSQNVLIWEVKAGQTASLLRVDFISKYFMSKDFYMLDCGIFYYKCLKKQSQNILIWEIKAGQTASLLQVDFISKCNQIDNKNLNKKIIFNIDNDNKQRFMIVGCFVNF